MSNVKSIFGEYSKVEAADDEKYLTKSCKEFIKESEEFTSLLIIEDDRHRNNIRWYSSKRVIQRGMSLLMMHELLVETLIEDYKEKYGLTSTVKKIESFFKKLVLHNQKTIEPYLYLIDMQECERELLEFI